MNEQRQPVVVYLTQAQAEALGGALTLASWFTLGRTRRRHLHEALRALHRAAALNRLRKVSPPRL